MSTFGERAEYLRLLHDPLGPNELEAGAGLATGEGSRLKSRVRPSQENIEKLIAYFRLTEAEAEWLRSEAGTKPTGRTMDRPLVNGRPAPMPDFTRYPQMREAMDIARKKGVPEDAIQSVACGRYHDMEKAPATYFAGMMTGLWNATKRGPNDSVVDPKQAAAARPNMGKRRRTA